MKKKMKETEVFSKENIIKKRKFPTRNTVFLIAILAIQITIILLAVLYTPTPDDIIKNYSIDVEPLSDGTLDISYSFDWQAISDEELTWVEIGMANPFYEVFDSSLSASIESFEKYSEDGYTSLRLYFNDSYSNGDVVSFSFKINQKNLLCRGNEGYFYEFVPGWFNSIPVENYRFRWRATDECLYARDAEASDGYHVWSGSFDCGGYKKLFLKYSDAAFDANAYVSEYYPFDSDGAYNSLEEDKIGIVILCVIIALVLVIAQVYILDSYVSYARGRGFITGHGYYYHVYGGVNPHYRTAAYLHSARTGGASRGGSGHSCACACACACAGGGRAGCSQKDTYGTIPFKNKKNKS